MRHQQCTAAADTNGCYSASRLTFVPLPLTVATPTRAIRIRALMHVKAWAIRARMEVYGENQFMEAWPMPAQAVSVETSD